MTLVQTRSHVVGTGVGSGVGGALAERTREMGTVTVAFQGTMTGAPSARTHLDRVNSEENARSRGATR